MAGEDYQNTVVYQQNTFGNPLYYEALTKEIISERLEKYYWPYHHALQGLIDQKKQHFANVYLLDLHSFAEYPNNDESAPADFVIGNQGDQTSSADLREFLAQLLEDAGSNVSNNHPFRGGFITRHYGKQAGIEALQLEIRYNQYIGKRSFGEEELTEYDPKLFYQAKEQLEQFFEKLYAELLNRGDFKDE